MSLCLVPGQLGAFMGAVGCLGLEFRRPRISSQSSDIGHHSALPKPVLQRYGISHYVFFFFFFIYLSKFI